MACCLLDKTVDVHRRQYGLRNRKTGERGSISDEDDPFPGEGMHLKSSFWIQVQVDGYSVRVFDRCSSDSGCVPDGHYRCVRLVVDDCKALHAHPRFRCDLTFTLAFGADHPRGAQRSQRDHPLHTETE